MRKKTKKLTVSAMLAALSVVVMLAGSIIEVMDLSVAALASFAVIFAILELGGAYPYMIFASVSILGMLLLPSKLPALYYLLFFGWYPLVKYPLERLNVWLSQILKAGAFALSVTAITLVSIYVAGMEDAIPLNVWVYVLCIPVFAIYDIALTRVTLTYLRVWKRRFRIDLSRR